MNEEQKKKRNTRQYEWQKENKDRINVCFPKGLKEEIKKVSNNHMSDFINAAVNEKLNGGTAASIPDLAAYAKSAGLDPEQYILEAVKEKMKKQDETFTESIKRVKID